MDPWRHRARHVGACVRGLGADKHRDPDLLVPLVAAWGAVSGILLLAEGLRLRRLARIWRPPAPETLP
jgi:hypothetical protein